MTIGTAKHDKMAGSAVMTGLCGHGRIKMRAAQNVAPITITALSLIALV